MAGASAGRWAVESRLLTPAEARALLDVLELLGHDPASVGELKVTSTEYGLRAEITHRAEPADRRLVIPTSAPRTPAPQLVITSATRAG